MDALNEKKWFVYMEDHHEGPFSVADVQSKIGEGFIRKDQYIWAEGMQDWKPMGEVQDFQFLFVPAAPANPEGIGAVAAHALVSGVVNIAAVDSEGLPALDVPIQAAMEQMEGMGSPDNAASLQMDTNTIQPLEISQTEASLPFDPSASGPHQTLAEGGHEDFTDASVTATNPKSNKPIDEQSKPTPNPTVERSRDVKSLTSPKQPGKQTVENMALVGEGPSVRGGKSKMKGMLKMLVFFGVLGGIGYGYSQGYLDSVMKNPAVRDGVAQAVAKGRELAQPAITFLIEKVPALGQFLSPIAKMSDVSDADFEDLRGAASVSLTSGGPAAGVAISTNSKNTHFYVASNLPEGAALVVQVEGNADTLLNATDFSAKQTVSIAKHLGQTKSFAQADGSALPKGEYQIYVYESDQQTEPAKAILDAAKTTAGDRLPRVLGAGKKMAASKKYFMGGAKDKTYKDRLKEYHDRVHVLAKEDSDELGQAFESLKNQFNGSFTLLQATHERLNKAKASPAGRGRGAKALFASINRDWKAKTTKWLGFQKQLSKFEKWTPEYMKNRFYPGVYAQMKAGGASLLQFYDAQTAFFANPLDPSLEAKLEEARKQTHDLLVELNQKKSKIIDGLAKPDALPAKVD